MTKTLEVLFNEDLRRRQQRRLMSVADHDERGDQCDDRFSAADISLQQAVHRSIGLQIVDDLLHHSFLCAGEFEGKNLFHFGAHRVVDANPARFLLHLFGCAADAHRELKREELLQDDPSVRRRTPPEKLVVQLVGSMQLFERRRQRTDMKRLANGFRKRIIERRKRAE